MKFLEAVLVFGVIAITSSAAPPSLRFIKTSKSDPGTWLTQPEIFSLIKQGQTFMDITEALDPTTHSNTHAPKDPPTETRFPEQVANITSYFNISRVESFIEEFSSYHTRYHMSLTGQQSQQWLFSQVQEVVQGYSGPSVVFEVDHGYPQKSIIARLDGSDPAYFPEFVIIGAHLDSVNKNGEELNAPGADDNSSGSSVVLETLRAIIESGQKLKRSVDFHWYAAEEIGLVGSRRVAELYVRNGVNVVGMLNLDVVGYHAPGINNIGVFTDNGDAKMAEFLRMLTNSYLDFGWQDETCGYACSDHASWNYYDFPAVFASEVVWNPFMHTVNDDITTVNFEQVKEFGKLAVAYAVEMAEPL